MRYITTKRFKGRCLCGEVNIPYGTPAEEAGGVISCMGKPICYATSQNAFDFFSRDDDGQGKRRGQLVQEIKKCLEKRDALYQERWDMIWRDERAQALRRKEHGDVWLWGFAFFNAPIPELERLLKLMKEVR